jgi:hypothetical protein
MDERIFSPRAEPEAPVVQLGGEWRAKQIQRLDAAPSPDRAMKTKASAKKPNARSRPISTTPTGQIAQLRRDMDTLGGTWPMPW